MKKTQQRQHLYSIHDLSRADIEIILDHAERLQAGTINHSTLHTGKIAGLCFFQHSTRTRAGFDVAMKKTGGSTTCLSATREVPHTTFTESLDDTLRVLSGYCDVLVVRHPDSTMLQKAMEKAVSPVINAGSGCEHHPTQALIDLFHIRKKFNKLDNLRLGFAGNLQSSRATRSLLHGLSYWTPKEIRLLAPVGYSLDTGDLAGIPPDTITQYDSLIAEDLDILYVAGLPNPQEQPAFSAETRTIFQVNLETAAKMPLHSVIMGPLPRIDEIDRALDDSPLATFFDQSDDGLWVRMSILHFFLTQHNN